LRYAFDAAKRLAADWRDHSTIEVTASDLDKATVVASQTMGVVRFLLRERINVNVDIHRVGLAGEVDHLVRDYLAFVDGGVGPGWSRLDGPVPTRLSQDLLSEWDSDDRVRWLSTQLALTSEPRSSAGERVITSLTLLDTAFLSSDLIVRVVLYAAAVEVLLADSKDAADSGPGPGRGKVLDVARRAAFLTCGTGCAIDREACPYVLGFGSLKHLWTTADQWAGAGEEWRCSAFLDIARHPDFEEYFSNPSLFGARNEAVHEGRTSLTESAVRLMRSRADAVIRAFVGWAAGRPEANVEDLDAEIADGAARFGVMRPARRPGHA
jgi:hypothetical protein